MKKSALLLAGLFASSTAFAGGLISATELNEIKDQDNVKVLDFRPGGAPEQTVAGAMAVTNSDMARKINGVGGMLLPQADFEALMSRLGITPTDTIVVTDENTMMWATRLWWALKTYGHQGDIFVLNGATAAWQKAGLPMAAPAAPSVKSDYTAKAADMSLVIDIEEITASFGNENRKVIDTRSTTERIAGHIPGSVFMEWKNNINKDGTYKSEEELAKLYTDAGLTADLEWIAPHCKSAVRSTHTMFALVEILGYDNVRNYDGSWLEYAESGPKKSYGL